MQSTNVLRLCFAFLVVSLARGVENDTLATTAITITTAKATVNDSIEATPQIKDAHLEGDRLCILNYGECMEAGKECSEDRALLEGLCEESPKRLCCAPRQREMHTWGTKDDNCISQFGECKLDIKNCTGEFQNFQCGGPVHRRCCTPDAKEAIEWEKGDTICKQSLGTCQLNLKECKGDYQVGTCGGPKQRQCCLPGDDTRSEWGKHDEKCLETWGTCTAAIKECSGKRDKTLCGGPDERQCCTPDKATVKSWESDDKKCFLEYGTCQKSTDKCDGKLDASKCGGPEFRQCCIPDSGKLTEWEKLDTMCTEKSGVCQSVATPCHQKYVQGYCGGPTEVRQCCLAPLKEGEKVVEETNQDSNESSDPEDENVSAAQSILKRFSSNLTLLLSVSIPALLVMIIALYCLIRRRGNCCRPYRKLRGDPKKTPWYKMEYNEMDDDEDVNLTMSEETKTYA